MISIPVWCFILLCITVPFNVIFLINDIFNFLISRYVTIKIRKQNEEQKRLLREDGPSTSSKSV